MGCRWACGLWSVSRASGGRHPPHAALTRPVEVISGIRMADEGHFRSPRGSGCVTGPPALWGCTRGNPGANWCGTTRMGGRTGSERRVIGLPECAPDIRRGGSRTRSALMTAGYTHTGWVWGDGVLANSAPGAAPEETGPAGNDAEGEWDRVSTKCWSEISSPVWDRGLHAAHTCVGIQSRPGPLDVYGGGGGGGGGRGVNES